MDRLHDALDRLGLDAGALGSPDIERLRLFAAEVTLRLLRIQRLIGLPAAAPEASLTEHQWQAIYAEALTDGGADPDEAATFAAIVWPEIAADIEREAGQAHRADGEPS